MSNLKADAGNPCLRTYIKTSESSPKLIESLNGLGIDDSTVGPSAPESLVNRSQQYSDHNNCMLSHENIERHTKIHYPRDHTLDIPDELLHITIADLEPEGVPGTSRSISPDSSHELETPEALDLSDHVGPFPNTITDSERSHHVHFRPRVRISSGFSRHRRQHFPSTEDDLFSVSPDSSSSSSLSSSISVPLRSPSDDETDKPGWGSLGQRVRLLAHKHRRQTRHRRRKQNNLRINPDECTPLVRSPPPTVCVEEDVVYDEEMDDSDRERMWPSREVDAVFGTWPGRLVNHHWWWWKLAPVVYCRCLDESDTE